ncbi:MAG: c-type cytochrome [Planctomycetes bacterium]|nr:c-type cytochrome [Planctomycetota bacterium]
MCHHPFALGCSLLLLLLLPFSSACKATEEQAAERSKPLEPEAALGSFETAPGVRIELVASEPEVIDPVSIRFDEEGRMWVVEMRDYPTGPKEGEPPASRIKILEDLDHDGRYETVHVFADELEFPTGVQPWRGGVFVTFAGKIAYLKDTDGDLRADSEEVWLTGFAEKNTQLRANHPTLGLDRKIYVANGLRGGEVVSSQHPSSKPLDIRSNDIRFDPVTRKFEPVAGMSQFGMTLDDFGNRFLCSNRNPLMHVVIEDQYVGRNPSYALPAMIEDVALAGEDSRIFPICRFWTTSLQHAGQFTAACAVTIYRGNGLPDEMLGNAFVCDPTGSLVRREILKPAGATFRSRAAREGVEFLASKDEWFRPVDLSIGPDGALYVVDMYRAVIEHPQFMPAELKNRSDMRDGNNRGRIYRLVADNSQDRPAVPQMSSATNRELVKLLEEKNAWTRETAARLLLELEDLDVGEELETVARKSKLPAARVAALKILSATKSLTPAIVKTLLADSHPGVRHQAVVLAQRWMSDTESLRSEVLALARDADPRVRFQVALSLAPMQSQAEVDALKHIAILGVDDIWTRRAVALSAADVAADLLRAFLADSAWRAEGMSLGAKQLVVEIAELAAKTANQQQQLEIVRALGELSTSEQVERLQNVILAALYRRGVLGQALPRLPEGDATHVAVQKIFDLAKKLADASDAEASRRLEAVALLSYNSESLDLLTRLAFDEPVQAVQLAAIDALSNHGEIEPWQTLLAEFSSLMPAVRSRVLGAMVRNENRSALLLDAVESGQILSTEIDRVSADQLRRHHDETILARVNKILPLAVPADREKVLADYQAALALPSDPTRGREVFRKQCATCHSVGGVGVRVGPNIGDNYAKTKPQLLADILQPNRAIDNNYVGYIVVTDDGRTLSGLLTSESATSLTLLQEESKQITLSKSEVEVIKATGLSMMPVGLEKNIPHQDMADLLSFLKNWRYLDGLTPYSEETKGK